MNKTKFSNRLAMCFSIIAPVLYLFFLASPPFFPMLSAGAWLGIFIGTTVLAGIASLYKSNRVDTSGFFVLKALFLAAAMLSTILISTLASPAIATTLPLFICAIYSAGVFLVELCNCREKQLQSSGYVHPLINFHTHHRTTPSGYQAAVVKQAPRYTYAAGRAGQAADDALPAQGCEAESDRVPLALTSG